MLVRRSAWMGAAAVLMAVVLRLTLRDRVPLLSAVFYATPFPALATVCVAAAVLFGVRRSWRRAGGAVALAAVCGILFAGTSWHSGPPPFLGPPEHKALFWNAARGVFGAQAVMDHVAEADADIVALGEAGATVSEADWRARFPAYDARKLDGGMLLMVRGSILETSYSKAGPGMRFNAATVETGGRRFDLILADMHSDPLRFKGRAFRELIRLIDSNAENPAIVMGDFNTPLESAWFDGLQEKGFTHAFEAGGRGMCETWPAFYPLLSIDHVWTSSRLRVTACRLGNSKASDHRSVLAEIVEVSAAPDRHSKSSH